MSGWNVKPRRPLCMHIGLIAAMMALPRYNEGDVWTCDCGVRFIVTRTGDGKTLAAIT